MEIWKDIPEFEGLYQVSNYGRVKSLERTRKFGSRIRVVNTRVLKPLKRNYPSVVLSKYPKGSRQAMIHRLVAEAFLPNPHRKDTVNHINGIKTDNRAENLEWLTHKENMEHASAMGLINKQRGEERHNSKLTEKEVREIKYISNSKLPISHATLGEIYNTAASNVSNIKNGYRWAHII